MRQYLILDEYRNELLQWCSENMEVYRDYSWFPFYLTSDGKDAFRLDIFSDEWAVIFNLTWGNILNDQSQPRPCGRSR